MFTLFILKHPLEKNCKSIKSSVECIVCAVVTDSLKMVFQALQTRKLNLRAIHANLSNISLPTCHTSALLAHCWLCITRLASEQQSSIVVDLPNIYLAET